MSDGSLNVASVDKSKNLLPTFGTLVSFAIFYPNGIWGTAMFGTPQILGGGITVIFSTGQKNILQSNKILYIRRP